MQEPTLLQQKVQNLEETLRNALEALEGDQDALHQDVKDYLITRIAPKVELLKERTQKLAANEMNKYLHIAIQTTEQELITLVKSKYQEVEAKKNRLLNTDLCLAILADLQKSLIPVEKAEDKLTASGIQSLFETALSNIATQIKVAFSATTSARSEAQSVASSDLALEKKLPSCFISYAWGVTAHEQLVHRLAKDLKAVGLRVLLDVWDNRAGAFINYFVQRVKESDYVILMGSKNLKRKHQEGKQLFEQLEAARKAGNTKFLEASAVEHAGFIVNKELEIISVKETHQPGSIIPLLLDGNLHECLPAEYSNVVPLHIIDAEQSQRYYFHVFELLKILLKQALYIAIVEDVQLYFFKTIGAAPQLSTEESASLLEWKQRGEERDKTAAQARITLEARSAQIPSHSAQISSSQPQSQGAYAREVTGEMVTVAALGGVAEIHRGYADKDLGARYASSNTPPEVLKVAGEAGFFLPQPRAGK